MTKHEIVAIRRQGFSILHTEGGEFAAKVTYQSYQKDGDLTHSAQIISEWLVPLSCSQ